MAEPAPATEQNEGRRIEMLRAAAELICERGFGDTRIADVAKRAGVSSALIIYYFGTRDRLLVDALRFSEESFYEAAEEMLADLVAGHEAVTRTARSVFPVADAANDESTADVITQRLQVHEKTAWMLRSMLG